MPYPLALKTKELYDVKFNNEEQKFSGLMIYPRDYFSPKSNHDSEMDLTKNTYAIHHFNGSWIPKCNRVVEAHLKK